MKSFQYKAKNDQGETVEGIIEADHFTDAHLRIKAEMRDLISLEEVKHQADQLRSSVFSAVEREHGQTDEERIKRKVEQSLEDGEVKKGQPLVVQVKASSKSEKPDGSIIFSGSPKTSSAFLQTESSDFSLEIELRREEQSLQDFLNKHQDALSAITKESLGFLLGKMNFIRDHQNRKFWKELRAEIKRALKLARRELEKYQKDQWYAYGAKAKRQRIDSYTEFEKEKSEETSDEDWSFLQRQKEAALFSKGWAHKLGKWLQIVDEPNETLEQEVLLKQQYESVWDELQKFSQALVFFYLACFFLAYYLKRNGADDAFLVRVYDAVLFKQIVLMLFGFFALTSLRSFFLPKRVKADLLLLLAWLGVVVVVL
ncbi:MAG: hypothetical protein Q8P95_00030 [bacterium]|nr:hypothetical protein [bacterium]